MKLTTQDHRKKWAPCWMLALCFVMRATGVAVDVDPVLRGCWTNMAFQTFAVQGDYAYAATRTNGLVVFDLRNKPEPKQVGSGAALRDATGMTVAGNYAF